MSSLPMIGGETFDETLRQSEDVPVVVKFTAAWCPPCRRIAPELDAVAADLAERARIVAVDVDAEPDLSARYGIRSIPALLVFKQGRVVEQMQGFLPRAEIARRLEPHV